MWRYVRAGILGILIGLAGGLIFGYVSYVKNYRDKLPDEIMSNAVMYDSSSDNDRLIRLKVDYDGDVETDDDRNELESFVGNMVMKQVGSWLGSDYSDRYSYIQMRHNLVMALDDINAVASEAAGRLGVDADVTSRMGYEYFNSAGDDCPAGYYDALCINLEDR